MYRRSWHGNAWLTPDNNTELLLYIIYPSCRTDSPHMELHPTSGIGGVHITPISQYPITRIPFQHGTPQSTMHLILMERVLEYNEQYVSEAISQIGKT